MTTWLRDVVTIMRPKHWIKNVFVLAPLAFAEGSARLEALTPVAMAFGLFCILSSAVYAFNDALDAQRDRLHPSKRRRPIASGRMSRTSGFALAAALAGAAMAWAAMAMPNAFVAIAALYLLNNVLYSAALKSRVIIDVISIAGGFVLRLLAGTAAIGVEPSSWLIVCGFSLALVLGFGKRRVEVTALREPSGYRPALTVYDASKLDTLMAICASIAILSFMLYTVAPETVELHGTANLMYTVPFVVYGMFRFIFKAQEGKGDGPVDILTDDLVLQANGVLWLLTASSIVHFS